MKCPSCKKYTLAIIKTIILFSVMWLVYNMNKPEDSTPLSVSPGDCVEDTHGSKYSFFIIKDDGFHQSKALYYSSENFTMNYESLVRITFKNNKGFKKTLCPESEGIMLDSLKERLINERLFDNYRKAREILDGRNK